MPRISVTRICLVALSALALAGCVVEPGYYYRPVAYVRPAPHVWVWR